MARKGIREFDAKRLLGNVLPGYGEELVLVGPDTDIAKLGKEHPWLNEKKLVVKPDQLFGKRGKHGLIGAGLELKAVQKWIKERMGKEQTIGDITGTLTHFLIEPFVEHKDEFYVVITTTIEKDIIHLSNEGGVDIESNWENVCSIEIPEGEELDMNLLRGRVNEIFPKENVTEIDDFVERLYAFFCEAHFTYLEKMSENNYKLFDKNTQAVIYGVQANAIQSMLNFDYICGRETPSVAAIVNENKAGYHKVFWGKEEILLPMYRTIERAFSHHPNADILINFASYRSAYRTSKLALDEKNMRTLVIIAEGVPERHSRELRTLAAKKDKTIIGPATIGGIVAGAFKIGNTGGTGENIVESKMHRPGSVGFVSKSGGMSNEAYNIIACNTDGLNEGIAIGGDAYSGSTLFEHVMRYEANPDIKMIVVLGEVGGDAEYKIVDALKEGRITKPVVAWVTGTCAKIFPASIQFGHAGAKADAAYETAEVKNEALKGAGAIVPESFNDFDKAIKDTYEDLVEKRVIIPARDTVPPNTPMDLKDAVDRGVVRRKTGFTSTIADDRGEELLYCGIPISKVIERGMGIGDIIGLLWFKKQLPEYASKFIELVLVLTADHGPAVSGAHNAIVTARAGRDLMSAVASGVLTIGPRFGGAVSGAAEMFKDAVDRDLTPEEFIRYWKNKGKNIQGIGHRIKSVRNPDKRVELLKEFASKHIPETRYLNYALEVEKLTTKKKDNLILNVDGAIGILFVDLMNAIGFTAKEIDDVVSDGGLNGLFLLGRTIGMIGHFFDQKRLREGLYRHPWADILYALPSFSPPRTIEVLSQRPNGIQIESHTNTMETEWGKTMKSD